MRVSWRSEWPHWIIIAGMILLAAAVWPTAPDSYPVHWNWAGQVDRYGGKAEVLLGFPLGTLALYLLLLLVPRVDPHRENYPRFAGAYSVIRLAITVGAALMYGVTLLAGYGAPVDTTLILFLLIGGLLVVLGNYMGKIRQNWFVGIRTPWTLSSRRSWNKTHRLGGWILIAMGLALMLAALLRSPLVFGLVTVLVVAGVVWIIVYSYLVWRDDPDRRSPFGAARG
ncbi:MAG: SdpI family protein [Sphingomonadaceae bacterium]